MSRYIDADKLLQYIGATERCGDCSYYENDIECRSHSLSRQDICNIVEDLVEESTDVQPVVISETRVDVDSVELHEGWIRIQWSGNIGFGEYIIDLDEDGIFRADSECMDAGDDKEFLKMLLAKIVEKVEVAR